MKTLRRTLLAVFSLAIAVMCLVGCSGGVGLTPSRDWVGEIQAREEAREKQQKERHELVWPEFSALVLEHREEIETAAHEFYKWRLASYEKKLIAPMKVWEMYKDSEDEALFDRAVDAWNDLRIYEGQWDYMSLCLDWYADDLSFFREGGAAGLDLTYRGVGFSYEEVCEILWDGREMPPDLPTSLPKFEVPEFPQYDGSPRAVEDMAKDLYDDYDHDFYYEFDATEAAMLYNDYVVENKGILERRGFFTEYPYEVVS